METLLGVDVGTTGLRAALFTPHGVKVAEAARACAPSFPRAGLAEGDVDAWWETASSLVQELGTKMPLASVRGVAVVGQAPTLVLLDDAGKSVRPPVLWLDTRAAREAEELGEQAYYLGPKLLWMSRHEAASIARARVVMEAHSLVAFRLTGEVAVDPSTAALWRPLYDPATATWREGAAAKVGLSHDQLPRVMRAGETIGAVTRKAASRTGLPEGTPVVVGGGDFAAATLAAGVIDEGEACLMLGTAGNLLVPRRTPGRDPRLIHAHHVGTERFLSLGGTLSGGAEEWLRAALVARGEEGPTFEVLEREAAQVAPGAEGLLFLPYLQGERTPVWDPAARGAFVGLGLNHGRGHLWRALLEGIALSFVDCQVVLEAEGVVVREAIAESGGSKSPLFRRILSDALGVPVHHAPRAGGTVSGAAILAGMGVGLVPGPEAARTFRGPITVTEPDLAQTARYRARLEIRRTIYGGLKSVFPRLAAVAG